MANTIETKAKKGPSMTAETVLVTPQKAADWLASNVRNNRPLSALMVDKYASDMAAGRWMQTGDGVKFDLDNLLVDGQHRLAAVVKSGVCVEMTVIRGLKKDVIKVLDTGKSRSGADALAIAGRPENASAIATLCRRIIVFNAGKYNVVGPKKSGLKVKGFSVTNWQVIEYCEQNDLSVHVRFAAKIAYHQVSNALSAGEMAFFHWLLSQKSQEAAEQFLTKLATLDEVSASSPIRTLVHKLTRMAAALDGKQKFHAVVQAWNAWRQGKENISINVGRVDDLPAPEPV